MLLDLILVSMMLCVVDIMVKLSQSLALDLS